MSLGLGYTKAALLAAQRAPHASVSDGSTGMSQQHSCSAKHCLGARNIVASACGTMTVGAKMSGVAFSRENSIYKSDQLRVQASSGNSP